MRRILYASLLLAVVASCKKKNEDINTNTPSKEQLVGAYRQSGETETVNGTTINTWNSTFYDACEMDNTTTLNADNTVVLTDTGVPCTPPDGGSSTWAVNGNVLTIAGIPATIVSFDGTTLVTQATTTFNGTTSTTTTTMVKQ
ncbi:MAG: hypothetical protein EOO16_07505 [Chitinophagaceae bacterium]|nr:MAG: hypothetical protein EOO16_07505 [Chitinophagaceae bacterium]